MENEIVECTKVYLKKCKDAASQTDQQSIYTKAINIIDNFEKIEKFNKKIEYYNNLLSIGLVATTIVIVILLRK